MLRILRVDPGTIGEGSGRGISEIGVGMAVRLKLDRRDWCHARNADFPPAVDARLLSR